MTGKIKVFSGAHPKFFIPIGGREGGRLVYSEAIYRVALLKVARISFTIATRSGIEKAIFIKTAP
jgi:hypothetical protein